MAIGQVAGDRAGGVGHHRLDAADVVRQPALDLARAGLGEEAQRHRLQVGVQRAAQVLHDVLADDVVEVALADPDQARDDRQDDHQADVEVELRVVLADDHLVEEQAEQQRVDQADQARGQDRDEDDQDLELVRLEEDRDAPNRARAPFLRDRGEVARTGLPNGPPPIPRPRPPPPPPAAPPVAVLVCPRGKPIVSTLPRNRRLVGAVASVVSTRPRRSSTRPPDLDVTREHQSGDAGPSNRGQISPW